MYHKNIKNLTTLALLSFLVFFSMQVPVLAQSSEFDECQDPGPEPIRQYSNQSAPGEAAWKQRVNEYYACIERIEQSRSRQPPSEAPQSAPAQPSKVQPQKTTPVPSQQAQQSETGQKPKIIYLDASKDIKPGETVTAKPNTILSITLPDGGRADVEAGGSFTYNGPEPAPNGPLETLTALKGKFHFVFDRNQSDRLKFRIWTVAVVAAVRGTEWTMDVDKSGNTKVAVLEGTVSVSDRAGTKTIDVPKNYQVVVAPGQKPGKIEAFDPSTVDRWFDATKLTQEDWNIIVGVAIFFIVAIGIFVYSSRILWRRRHSKK